MTEVTLPVLKAWDRIFELLKCIKDHPYDRDGFQEAVLELYPGKSPKSVFRGMAVPTLRSLGFIVGYGDVIHISANGALAYAAHQESETEGLRLLRAILLEMDRGGELVCYLMGKPAVSIQALVNDWISRIHISDPRVAHKPEARDRAAGERIRDWIDFWAFAQLVYTNGEIIRIHDSHLTQARNDTAPSVLGKRERFANDFFGVYKEVVVTQKGVKTVEIEDLRRDLALRFYSQSHLVLTEKQFDDLLTYLPKVSNQYTITLGRSMGADEKLFHFQGNYYQTLSVRFASRQFHEEGEK
jgi:hypothetical protein